MKNNKDWCIFANNIHLLRINNNYSKKKMAEILNIGVGSLRKIEKGECPKRLKADIIYNLSQYFNLKPSQLFEENLF